MIIGGGYDLFKKYISYMQNRGMIKGGGGLTCFGPGIILPVNSISDSVSSACVTAKSSPVNQKEKLFKRG
jgi:hypothetical protein